MKPNFFLLSIPPTFEEMQGLEHRLAQIEAAQSVASSSELTIRTATAQAPGTLAVRLLDTDDYQSMSLAQILALCKNIKPGTSLFIDSARAQAPGTQALVISPKVDVELAQRF